MDFTTTEKGKAEPINPSYSTYPGDLNRGRTRQCRTSRALTAELTSSFNYNQPWEGRHSAAMTLVAEAFVSQMAGNVSTFIIIIMLSF